MAYTFSIDSFEVKSAVNTCGLASEGGDAIAGQASESFNGCIVHTLHLPSGSCRRLHFF